MKSKLTINVDTYILEEAKEHKINFSQTMEEVLKHKLSYLKQDIKGIDIIIIKKELKKEENKMLTSQQKVNTLRENIKKHEEMIQNDEINRLKEEKDKIDKAKTCVICNNLINDKERIMNITKDKIAHRNCYLTIDPIEMRKYEK